MRRFIHFVCCALLFGCSQSHKNPHILIITSLGDIEVEVLPAQAPITAAAFLSYIDSGFYNNSSFYRVVLQEGLSPEANIGLIQGGTWQTTDKDRPAIKGIIHESTKETGLSHKNGTISLARTGPGTANTEFFICIGDQSQFDFGNGSAEDTLGFAAFGTVVKGMATVRKIQGQPKTDQHFNQKIVINKIKRV